MRSSPHDPHGGRRGRATACLERAGDRAHGLARPARRDRRRRFLGGPIVRTLLDGPLDVHPYRKWEGAHWRLVSLAELELPPGEPRALAAADAVLGWLTGEGHRRAITTINGLVRRCGSQEGN